MIYLKIVSDEMCKRWHLMMTQQKILRDLGTLYGHEPQTPSSTFFSWLQLLILRFWTLFANIPNLQQSQTTKRLKERICNNRFGRHTQFHGLRFSLMRSLQTYPRSHLSRLLMANGNESQSPEFVDPTALLAIPIDWFWFLSPSNLINKSTS